MFMEKPPRLISLDAFRGFTMMSMVLVNNPGSWEKIYQQLEHASWHGWTFTDTIFPSFLWIVGVAMTFSFAVRKGKGDSNSAIIVQAFRRAAIIFGLGLFLSCFPFGLIGKSTFDLATVRIPGVLQRIAICYFFSTLVYLYFSVRGQIAIIVGLLSSYWVMMKFIPVPGIVLGNLEANSNFASYIDSIFLKGHMWKYTCTWDPEGIISTIPSLATTLAGILTGEYLRTSSHSAEEKTSWMFVFSAGLLFIGAFLSFWMPINKSLWTSTYAIFMAGWSLGLFAVFYFLIDAKGYQKWSFPCIVFGMNAIFIYVLSSIQENILSNISVSVQNPDSAASSLSLKDCIYHRFLLVHFEPLNASLVYALLTVFSIGLIAWVMYRKKWFIKV
ncbi:MAG: DUF5009 domain-containing protein [Candidatus Riflebacteria bacterium]|nr:DUF5009 domain-containing protein [Candidatus Riflebacteria bacterium]